MDEVRWRFKRGGGVGGKGERRRVLGLGLRVGGGEQKERGIAKNMFMETLGESRLYDILESVVAGAERCI